MRQACYRFVTRSTFASYPKGSLCTNMAGGLDRSDVAKEVEMAAIAQVLDHALGIKIDIEPLRTPLIFCGVGLAVSLLLASIGFDLNPGSF
jgi:hypothetical protein